MNHIPNVINMSPHPPKTIPCTLEFQNLFDLNTVKLTKEL